MEDWCSFEQNSFHNQLSRNLLANKPSRAFEMWKLQPVQITPRALQRPILIHLTGAAVKRHFLSVAPIFSVDFEGQRAASAERVRCPPAD